MVLSCVTGSLGHRSEGLVTAGTRWCHWEPSSLLSLLSLLLDVLAPFSSWLPSLLQNGSFNPDVTSTHDSVQEKQINALLTMAFIRRDPFSNVIQQILPHTSSWVMPYGCSKTKHVKGPCDFCDWPREACGCRRKTETLSEIDAFLEWKKKAEFHWASQPTRFATLLYFFIFRKLTQPDHLQKTLLGKFFYMEQINGITSKHHQKNI